MRLKTVAVAAVLAASPALGPLCAAPPTPASAAQAHQAQVEVRTPAPPQVVEGSDGVRHLAYELHVTNFYASTGLLRLRRISIFTEPDGALLKTFRGAEVDALLAQHEPTATASGGATIDGGKRAVLFLWLDLPKGARKPTALRHRLEFEMADGGLQVAEAVRTPVVAADPVVVGPPLRGGRWLAVEGPGNHLSHHWGSLVAVGGQVTIPQRFASDWFGLDAAGHAIRTADRAANKTTDADWVGFGADVLAVADGVVRDVRDGVADGTPLAPQEEPDDLTARSLYGNFVVLEIAPHVFAHYAHLRNGSVAVKVGDRVRRGAEIAELGQTGAAGAPHLHFQITDAATFEGSEGLPFAFDAFSLLGSAKIEDTLDASAKSGAAITAPVARHRELPLDGAVVGFAP